MDNIENIENLDSKEVLKNIFKINRRLELLVATADNLYEEYKTRIEEVTDDYLVIAMPMVKGVPVKLERGQLFSGRLLGGNLSYQFDSSFIERRLSALPVWLITWPSNVSKTQQRSFVRMDVMLPAMLTVKSQKQEADEQEKINTTTKDISGGGMQLIMKKPLALGTKIHITVDIPDCGLISAEGEVARLQQPQTERILFWVGIKFVAIQEKARSNIIKFIFRKQLELRAKKFGK